MSTLSLRLPNSLHRQLREVARQEGVSINQLINSAAAEKLASLLTLEHLETRGARGERGRFDRVLAKVADLPAIEADRVPRTPQRRARPSERRRA